MSRSDSPFFVSCFFGLLTNLEPVEIGIAAWLFGRVEEECVALAHKVVEAVRHWQGVGLKVVAIADHDTPFETIRVPEAGDFKPYVMLCASWNLLVEIGIATGINLDKPERARKVGNELIV